MQHNRIAVFLLLSLLTCICFFVSACRNSSAISPNNRMKRVVLEKNLVDGNNILTQSMLNCYGDSTIFVVKHDFSLNGEQITLPSNCTLHFKGGCFRNGIVDFNYCRIVSKGKAFYDVRFIHLEEFIVDFFSIPSDATYLLQDVLNSCSKVDFKGITFNTHKVLKVDCNHGELFISNLTINALPEFEVYQGEALTSDGAILYVRNVNKGTIKNLKLNGNRFAQKGIFFVQCHNVHFEECSFVNFDGTDKTMSWGIRCNNCSNIELSNSVINNIIALPVGKNGGCIGSAAGVVYEHTVNSCIIGCTIDDVQSTRDGDAIHIISIPNLNNQPVPSRDDLYDNVNVVISNNTIKANKDSKRCIKIQANGVKVVDNYLQKLYKNKTNVISIYGSNVAIENNIIDSEEYYTIGIGASYLDLLSNIVVRNNTINHQTTSDWRSCIYVAGSSLKNFVVEHNTVNIQNHLNSFCDIRGGLDSVKVSNNIVKGGSHFFRVRNEINNAIVNNLELSGNEYNGEYDLLAVEKDRDIHTSYETINVYNNTFNGGSESKRMIEVVNIPEITNCLHLNNNRSNKIAGL